MITELDAQNPEAEGIRFIFVKMGKFKSKNGIETPVQVFEVTSPLRIPEGLTLSDACYLSSHIINTIRKERQVERGSSEIVKKLSSELETLGFTKLRNSSLPVGYFSYLNNKDIPFEEIPHIVDLILPYGNSKDFKESSINSIYKPWASKKTDEEKVKKILKTLNTETSEM